MDPHSQQRSLRNLRSQLSRLQAPPAQQNSNQFLPTHLKTPGSWREETRPSTPGVDRAGWLATVEEGGGKLAPATDLGIAGLGEKASKAQDRLAKRQNVATPAASSAANGAGATNTEQPRG